MTLEQLTAKTYKKLQDQDFGGGPGRQLAIQVNLTGKVSGVFYIEVKDGVVSVMPYEYIDRDASLFVTMTNFEKLLTGKLDAKTAYTDGKLKIEGDVDKVIALVRHFGA